MESMTSQQSRKTHPALAIDPLRGLNAAGLPLVFRIRGKRTVVGVDSRDLDGMLAAKCRAELGMSRPPVPFDLEDADEVVEAADAEASVA